MSGPGSGAGAFEAEPDSNRDPTRGPWRRSRPDRAAGAGPRHGGRAISRDRTRDLSPHTRLPTGRGHSFSRPAILRSPPTYAIVEGGACRPARGHSVPAAFGLVPSRSP